ncbi:MAG: hypothetical protein K6A23_07090 [Butyrivibrio sp.]|nr:hypothetical protein [Butyrivibrio sp.]
MALEKLGSQMNTGYVQEYGSVRIPKVQESGKNQGITYQPQQEITENAPQKEAAADAKIERKATPIEEMSISFNTKDSSLIGFGGNFNIATDDMKKAISAMQKDSVLHQYQYFVGSSQTGQNIDNTSDSMGNIIYNGDEGMVLRK